MAKFRFPRNPNADRDSPFEDEHGTNPFGDDAPRTEPDGQEEGGRNPYSPAESNAVQPYRPGDYETFLPNRGALVLWLGIVGCGIQLLGVVFAVFAIVALGEFLNGLACGLPGQFIGVAVSAPAWIMAQSDLKAIAAGAMQSEGLRATRWGLALGMIGTVVGASQLFLCLGLAIFEGFFD